ncbi:MAG: hypothetical protein HFI67_06935 [Lachnospiraceae bacterium]|jgi:hypothetical protein|nr:hypothetical protein [Lachnospiraceae bacterium]
MVIGILKKQLKTACHIGIIFLIGFRFALFVGKNKDKTIQKYKTYYQMLVSWMDLLERGKYLSNYLEKYGYNRVAVYGGHDTGRHLVKQLQGTRVCVEYIIDRDGSLKNNNFLPIYHPDDQLPKTDAIVVTPIWDYQNIKEKLSAKISCPVISLQEIIEGMKDV